MYERSFSAFASMPSPSKSLQEDSYCISGNAPSSMKSALMKTLQLHKIDGFAPDVAEELVLEEVSLLDNNDGYLEGSAPSSSKQEARVVLRTTVTDLMANVGGSIHGGCSAYLIDICSTLALIALGIARTGKPGLTVSQTLNVVYHSPASTGNQLRIVNTTISVGARVSSTRTEIWDITTNRLVASGVHIKMNPSIPKANL
ncbi:HotDog domain-containing protein [Mycena floridula]|nr:HotDog domain-containing protein [Mycena floridula]